MPSSNGNIFRVTGPLCGEFTVHRWIPLTKANDAEPWCFFFICAWMNDWVKNREAGILRRHRAHYDVRLMRFVLCWLHNHVLGHWWLCCTIKGHIMAVYFIQYNDRCKHIAPMVAVSGQTWHASEGFASGCMYMDVCALHNQTMICISHCLLKVHREQYIEFGARSRYLRQG